MATNRQGKGTANVAVNLLDEERALLARIACQEDRSLGDLIRRMAVVGLRTKYPETAQMLDEARKRRREQMVLKLEDE